MQQPRIAPTVGDAYRIVTDGCGAEWNFAEVLRRSREQEHGGDIEGACNTRFEAFQRLMEIIPDNKEMSLDWEDATSQEALALISCSAVDHFLVGDFEMCAGMLELLLELDPEDHLEASKMLAYCYIALEDHELFDEVIYDINDKYPEKEILVMWSEFRRKGVIPDGEYRRFRTKFPAFFREFIADEHPVNEEYVREIEVEKPPKEILAREMWLQTEHLWMMFPGFIEALKVKAQ